MSEKVRRILFDGHLLFNISDVAEYLEIGSFTNKMKKAGVAPITLPVLKELGVGDGVNSFWLTWDDLFKMDQKLKWAKTDIGGLGKKLHMLRMWSRNKDGQPYRLNHATGNLEFVNIQPQQKENQAMAKATTKQQTKPAMTVNIVKDKTAAPAQDLFTKPSEVKDITVASILPQPESKGVVDINLELMSLVENTQIETIKVLRDRLDKMDELLRAEQANVQRVTQELHEIILHLSGKVTPVVTVSETSVEPEVEVSAPVIKKKERKQAHSVIPSRKDDPMPDHPKIIALDARSGRFVREMVGPGYATSKIFLGMKGKPIEKKSKSGEILYRYHLALTQKAQYEVERQQREREVYHVPSMTPTRGNKPENSNDVAYPIDILEKVLPKVKFD